MAKQAGTDRVEGRAEFCQVVTQTRYYCRYRAVGDEPDRHTVDGFATVFSGRPRRPPAPGGSQDAEYIVRRELKPRVNPRCVKNSHHECKCCGDHQDCCLNLWMGAKQQAKSRYGPASRRRRTGSREAKTVAVTGVFGTCAYLIRRRLAVLCSPASCSI